MTIRPDPENVPTYKQEFKQSIEIFDKSFHGAVESDFDPQKEQYYKAMKTALEAMGDSANGMINQHLIEMKQKLDHDVKDYMAHPTQEKQRVVEDDIQNLKKEAD